MEVPFLVGDDIYLRPLCDEDVDGPYYEWLNNPEITLYLESGYFPTSKNKLREIVNSFTSHPDILMLAIVQKKDDKYIGNIKMGPIRWIHRLSDLGILIGERECMGKGYSVQALRLVTEYAFNCLNLRKIFLAVVTENIAAFKAYSRVGFEIEGCLKEQGFYNGHYCDSYIMGLLRDKYFQRGEQ